jgi:hypothetical protein
MADSPGSGTMAQKGCMVRDQSCDQQTLCSAVGSACGRKEHCAAAAWRLRGEESARCGRSERDGKASCGWRGRKREKGEFEECGRSKLTQLEKRSMWKHHMGSGDGDPTLGVAEHCMPREERPRKAFAGAASSWRSGCSLAA